MVHRVLAGVRGLLPVFGIAVAVALVGTVTGYAWDHVHKVVAEEQVSHGTPARPGGAGAQILTLGDWGVTASLPLAAELPLLSYAEESGDVVGLSSADLMKLGSECQPGKNPLGTLARYQAGTYGKNGTASVGSNVVATVGNYDFVYQFPQTACADQPAGMTIINRETPIILEALSSLASVPAASPAAAATQ